jgi:long-chain acyl-CoA synthetase
MTTPDLGANLVAMFQRSAARRGEAPFLWAKQEGSYRAWSWHRAAREIATLARCLADLGLAPGDRVLLVAENRPEWCIADLAVLSAGGVTVPAYISNTSEDHAYLLEHSGAMGVICSGPQLAKWLLPAVAQARGVRFLVTMDPLPDTASTSVPVLSWQEAMARGESAPEVDFGSRLTRSDLACLIYTSGTGGRPKGVMLSHGNIMANLAGAWHLLEILGIGDEVFLCFLPLSHAYEHTAGQFLPIGMAAEIYYAEGVETLSTNLVEARPTILTCVPRLYEVMRHKITTSVDRQGGLHARLFHLAVDLGKRRLEAGSLPLHLRLVDALLDPIVRRKVRMRFGGRLKAMVSGGAPLNPDVGRFFQALGLPVLQGYGQTEAAPVVSVNLPGRARIETVGPPLQGVEVKIAEDGEILVRGEIVMQGYWKDPEATAKALRDGWLHTGDIGVIDPDGFIRITDRKKDIIVNSGGDNIAPARVEGVLLLEPEVGQALVFGDQKPHLVALVVPHHDFTKKFARMHGCKPDMPELAQNPAFKAAIGEAVGRANRRLSSIERVRKFQVMPEPFSIENGYLTPTMKLRRHLIIDAHKDLLERLYASGR